MSAAASYLEKHAEDEVEAQALYNRFLWELRRGGDPAEALEAARAAAAFAEASKGPDEPLLISDGRSEADLEIGRCLPRENADADADSIKVKEVASEKQDPLSKLAAQVQRGELKLTPGEHRTRGPINLINWTDANAFVSMNELEVAFKRLETRDKLTVIVDDHAPSARSADNSVIWNVNTQDDAEEAWRPLLELLGYTDAPEWAQAITSFRSVCSDTHLDSEHQVRIKRVTKLLKHFFTSQAFGATDGETIVLEDEEVEWMIDGITEAARHYITSPRMVLHCHAPDDLSPADAWQDHGPQGLRALLNVVTGDDPYLSAALEAAPRLRLGGLGYIGDPDNNNDDVVSATVPLQGCYAILKPEALERCVIFSGVPHPGALLPVPQLSYGLYNTVAVGGQQASDMLLARALLSITPSTPKSVRSYIQGREQHLYMSGPGESPGFQTAITAAAVAKEGHTRYAEHGLHEAAAVALFYGMVSDWQNCALGAVHLGALNIEDVEAVIAPCESNDEWLEYRASGELPERLRELGAMYESYGVKLRARDTERGGMLSPDHSPDHKSDPNPDPNQDPSSDHKPDQPEGS